MYDFVRWSANCDKSVLFSSEFLLLRSIFFRIFHPLLQKINGSSQNIPITHFKWEEPDIRYKPTSAILSCQILRQITLGASAETFQLTNIILCENLDGFCWVTNVLEYRGRIQTLREGKKTYVLRGIGKKRNGLQLEKIRFPFIKFPSRGNVKLYLFIFDLLCYPSRTIWPKS